MTKPTMSVQIYSVRDLFTEGNELKTLKEISAIGYEGVEFTEAIMKYPADKVAGWLKEAGLICTGMTAGWDFVVPEKLNATLDFLDKLSCKNLIIGYAPFLDTRQRDKLSKIIETINAIYVIASKRGFYTAYHAHYPDFYSVDGVPIWDRIFKGTPQGFGMCVDTGNMLSVGADPIMYINKYPSRSKVCHLKPFDVANNSPSTMVDDDGYNWKLLTDTCLEVGGARCFVVEYGVYKRYAPMEAIKLCYDKIRAYTDSI